MMASKPKAKPGPKVELNAGWEIEQRFLKNLRLPTLGYPALASAVYLFVCAASRSF
jgi:hypothetical protein